jgi:flagellin
MRINTNVSAMNTNRQLGMSQQANSSSLEKLSSGFRINRAGDDAAGLGIANKLRADTRSLTQASKNAEQATSVLQIMEGATGSIGKIVERVKELATQAASDNTDTGGRTRLDAEYQALLSEINRIASTTSFQGKSLINGTFGNTVSASSTVLAATTTVANVQVSGAVAGSYTVANTAGSVTMTNGTTTQTVAAATGGAQTLAFSQFGLSVNLTAAYSASATVVAGNLTVATGSGGGTFMVSSSGAYTGNDNISLSSVDLRASALTLASDLTSVANAQTVLGQADTAIGNINTALGTIGASQNRLSYALSNAKTAIQNFSAAESVIRDVDMAEEMINFTKTQILSQAGTAMLAQANQAPQGVLQLLRG